MKEFRHQSRLENGHSLVKHWRMEKAGRTPHFQGAALTLPAMRLGQLRKDVAALLGLVPALASATPAGSFDAADNNVVGLPPNTPKSRLSPLRTAITRH